VVNVVGIDTSIAIGADGLPIVSHRDSTARALRVTHCGTVDCTSGNVSTNVDDPANLVGAYSSIALGADGLPIVSHYGSTAAALRVTHCGNADCTQNNVSTTVDNAGGAYTSIAIGPDGAGDRRAPRNRGAARDALRHGRLLGRQRAHDGG
jgi:hypothetical protein